MAARWATTRDVEAGALFVLFPRSLSLSGVVGRRLRDGGLLSRGGGWWATAWGWAMARDVEAVAENSRRELEWWALPPSPPLSSPFVALVIMVLAATIVVTVLECTVDGCPMAECTKWDAKGRRMLVSNFFGAIVSELYARRGGGEGGGAGCIWRVRAPTPSGGSHYGSLSTC
uniref:Uncharacterized protein n=1 Tax=Oryza nivara TaxID=4536 RepID=A0A0E0IRW4_ORYNI